MADKRFRIAFSFTGERRDYVAQVAALVAAKFGKEHVLYDKYHEAEFSRARLGRYLPKLYHDDSTLIVLVICPDYSNKEWCGLEWDAIFDLLKKRREDEVMLARFKLATLDGLYSDAGYAELDDKTPEQFVELILQRLALNEGHPKDHYTSQPDIPNSEFHLQHSPVPSNLPGGYIGQLFVGREDFLKNLHASLRKQKRRPVATVAEGLGGLGKTHAAVEYADRHRTDYTALLFVPGDSPQRLQSGFAALCEVPGLVLAEDLPKEEEARASIALHWLATHKDWLLIVDNVDDEAAVGALTAHFDQLRRGYVLITSRLHKWSGNVEALDLSVLSEKDGADLLLQITDKHRRKAADDDVQALALSKLMEGLPLALHQAAGYIHENLCTLAQYLTTYQSKAAELLNWFNHLSIPYERPDKLAQRPVLITWKTSFDKLTTEARMWLLVFSHFAPEPIPEFLMDGADTARLQTLSRFHYFLEHYIPFCRPRTNALQSLAQMTTLGLITRSKEGTPRFKIHRLVQEVTRINAKEAERASALALAIRVVAISKPGDPQDVRTWIKWTPLQPHAQALCQYAPDEHSPNGLTGLLGALDCLLATKGLHTEAEKYSRRALQIDRANLGPRHPDVAYRLNNLAQILQATNRTAEAEPLMQLVVTILENKGGEPLPNYAGALNNLASLLHATNRMAEAEPMMRRALQIDEENFGPDHPKVAVELNNLASLLQDTNRMSEAEPMMRRALQIDEENFGPDDPHVAIRLNNLSTLLKSTNRIAESEHLMKRALSISIRRLGQEHPNTQKFYRNYIGLLEDLKLSDSEVAKRVKEALGEA